MLAILSTHPIQYQVPVWQALARDGRIPFEVWYLSGEGTNARRDREFQRDFSWDIPTLEGYRYRFLQPGRSALPTSFWGCRLPANFSALLKDTRPTVLWIQGWQVAGYWQAAAAAKRAGVEVWLRGESNDLSEVALWKKLIKRSILNWLFRRVDHFLYIGAANRRLYERYGVVASRLHEAPYAVDNTRFAGQAAELVSRRSEIRRRWAIPKHAFCMLFCGKFIEKKRPRDIVYAAKRLIESGKILNVHLLFAGSGALGKELRQACTVVFDADSVHLPLSEPIATSPRPSATFTGFLNQTEISRAYIAADCLVLPSDSGETWGLVVNEAMASGLPCIASRACGCAEDLLTPNWPERTFSCGDIEGLAEAAFGVWRGEKTGEAERTAVERYSVDATVEQVVKLFGAVRIS